MNTVKYLTWEKLADKINKMSEDEKAEPVRIWGENMPLCEESLLCVEKEDLCYYPEYSDEGCEVRSNWEPEDQENIVTALAAGKHFLSIS